MNVSGLLVWYLAFGPKVTTEHIRPKINHPHLSHSLGKMVTYVECRGLSLAQCEYLTIFLLEFNLGYFGLGAILFKRENFYNSRASIHFLVWGQDPLAINTELKSVTNSELLNLAISFQKMSLFWHFSKIFVLTEKLLLVTLNFDLNS